MNIIEVNHLEKIFYSEFLKKPVKVLNDISFVVPEGTTFGMLGPNGAGKTTTMKILLGLLKPSKGEVKFLGQKTTSKKAREKIGFMPENPYYYSYLNGYELLELCADLYGLKSKQKKERIEELLETVNMTSSAYTRLGKASKGMMQRIGLAQALLNDPEFILLDEPMSGLDPLGRKEIKDIILSLKQKKKTIFFNSHILSDVQELCDSIAILKLGKMLITDSVENILNTSEYNNLEDYFVNIVRDKKDYTAHEEEKELIAITQGDKNNG